ncbi:MAG: MBL fold metallo-hydrolase [Spirochaetota bacterium]
MRLSSSVYLIGSGLYGLSHKFDCSVYLVECGDELIVIDAGAGCNPDKIIENVVKDGLEPAKLSRLFLTHGHADHAGGAHYLRERYGVQVYIGEAEAEMVEQGDEVDLKLEVAKKSGFYSPEYKFTPCAISVRLHHNDSISIGSLVFKALHVPGHSRGSFCYLVDLSEGRAVFSGDTVFADGVIGMLNCDGSELSDYRRYIHRLADRNIKMLFPGHRVFVLEDGQQHVDQAVESLGRLFLPRNFI